MRRAFRTGTIRSNRTKSWALRHRDRLDRESLARSYARHDGGDLARQRDARVALDRGGLRGVDDFEAARNPCLDSTDPSGKMGAALRV